MVVFGGMSLYSIVGNHALTYIKIQVGAKVSFSLNRAGKKINWQNSKRLLPGTLVCLSCDGFQEVKNMKLATVLARPISGLEMNPPEVDVLFREDEIEIDASKAWVMVESRSSYFEGWCALQPIYSLSPARYSSIQLRLLTVAIQRTSIR